MGWWKKVKGMFGKKKQKQGAGQGWDPNLMYSLGFVDPDKLKAWEKEQKKKDNKERFSGLWDKVDGWFGNVRDKINETMNQINSPKIDTEVQVSKGVWALVAFALLAIAAIVFGKRKKQRS